MNNNFGNEREKTILDDPTLKLYGIPVGNARRSPSMHWYYANNQPRIDVYINAEENSNDNLIRANLAGTRQLDEFFNMFQEAIDSKEVDFAKIMEIKESFYIKAENRFDEPKLRSKLVCGRDKEGRVFIALLSTKESVAKVLFYFKNSDKHSFYKRGDKPNEIETSTIAAQGWLDSIKRAYAYVIPTAYKHKEKQQNKNGGGRGNNNQSNSRDYYKDDGDTGDSDGLPF